MWFLRKHNLKPRKNGRIEKEKTSVTDVVKEIKRRTKRIFSSEEKIRSVLDGFRGEDSIAAICRKYDLHINT